MRYLLLTFLLSLFWLSAKSDTTTLIKEVLIDGETVPFQENSKISFRSDQVLFVVIDQDKLKDSIYYQLENHEDTLQYLSTTIISYSGLRVGSRVLILDSKKGNRMKIKLEIVAGRKDFFNDWTFFTLLIIYLSLILGGALFFIHLSKTRYNQREIEIRATWAKRLHTDIGGDLSGLELRFKTFEKKIQTPGAKIQSRIRGIQEILDEIQQKLRFLFNLIDPIKDSFFIMLETIEHYAIRDCKEKDIQFHFEKNIELTAIKMDIGRINKLYLILKEIILNAIKYSEAHNIYLIIKREGKGIQITVSDDGIGFDKETVDRRNGLDNIESDAKKGFMDLEYQSEINQGTIFKIFIPNL